MTIYKTSNDAFLSILADMFAHGEVIPSRNGTTLELPMQQFTIEEPSGVTLAARRGLLPAQIAETMWVLAGRNDIDWLSHYLPRAKEFSDDGVVWRGAYGPRIRAFGEGDYPGIDQLAHVVQLLKRDPMTRRAVMSIYDPVIDSQDGKDIPCNNWLHFLYRGGKLHLHVATRSNDIMWGWSGINVFEWSALLSVVAGLSGLAQGSITFSISSLHLYQKHWERARKIVAAGATDQIERDTEFMFSGSMADFQELLHLWFRLEEKIRNGEKCDEEVQTFPEPMLRSWLWILWAWHIGSPIYDGALHIPQSLITGYSSSPKKEVPVPVDTSQDFVAYASQLHAEKHSVYGDSWKRRGEMLGILANIARKVDRLAVAGGGDTAADTAVDLLIYLIKYYLWLRDDPGYGTAHVAAVSAALQRYSDEFEDPIPEAFQLTQDERVAMIRQQFDGLEKLAVEEAVGRWTAVERLIRLTYPLAESLWAKEEQWKQGNAMRSWNPEKEMAE